MGWKQLMAGISTVEEYEENHNNTSKTTDLQRERNSLLLLAFIKSSLLSIQFN